jgi:hypothetical protein
MLYMVPCFLCNGVSCIVLVCVRFADGVYACVICLTAESRIASLEDLQERFHRHKTHYDELGSYVSSDMYICWF